jgi:hypothetical protein
MLVITNNGPAAASNVNVTVGPCPLLQIPFASPSLGVASNSAGATLWSMPTLGAGSNANLSMAYLATSVSSASIADLFAVATDDNSPFASTGAELEVDPPTISVLPVSNNTFRVITPAQFPSVLLSSPELTNPLSQWQTVSNNFRMTVGNQYVYTLPASNAASFFRFEAPNVPATATAEIFQAAMDLDDAPPVAASGEGILELELPQPGLQYLNLEAGPTASTLTTNEWLIQNEPLDGGGTNLPHTIFFPLGTNYATYSVTNYPTIKYNFTLTSNILVTPVISNPIVVKLNLHPVRFRHGQQDEYLSTNTTLILTFPIVGGAVVASAYAQPDFPNRKQDTNECAPAAVWNSLHYLKNNGDTNLADGDITIAAMKTAVGWTSDGAPGNWPALKGQYMTNHNIPIVTMETTNPAVAMSALSATNDVEIRMWGHVACVTGIRDLGGGVYSIDILHDIYQGFTPGGRVTQTVTLNTSTGMLSGPWATTVKFREFVIERPPP